MIHRRLLLSCLLSVGLCLIVWIAPTYAALLKDIRIGEYDRFTRIVFDLDTTVDSEMIVSKDSDRLQVDFPGTQPDLIRKIPIERADIVKDIKIQTLSDKLSAIFKFSTRHKQVDSFPLQNPPRVVVDVYWQTSSSDKSTVSTASTSPDALERIAESSPSIDQHQPPQPIARPNVVDETAIPGQAPMFSLKTETTGTASAPTSAMVASPPERAANPVAGSLLEPSPPRSNRLQYYLVVALVIITIIILFLLVLMLLTRYRWMTDKSPLSTNEFLQRQEDRIAMINARIKEQLNRYDEA